MAIGPAYGGDSDYAPTATIDAAGDLSGYQYRFVTVNGDGELELTTFANGPAEGVLQNQPVAQGADAVMTFGGVTKVVSGAEVTYGAKVASDNTGRAVVAGAGAHVLGTALTACGAADAQIDVLLISQHILSA